MRGQAMVQFTYVPLTLCRPNLVLTEKFFDNVIFFGYPSEDRLPWSIGIISAHFQPSNVVSHTPRVAIIVVYHVQ